MKLYQITKIIEKLASLEHINSVYEGDIYELNSRQDVEYPAFVITQGQHINNYNDSNFTINYNVFFVDRLLDDKSNELEIQNWATEAIKNLVNTLTEYKLGYVSGTNSVSTFTERFDSLCAGAVVSVNIVTTDEDCEDAIKLVTSVNGKTGDVNIPAIDNLKTINGESIIGTGNIEIKGGGAVDSVNGKTGEVVLTLGDITDETFVNTDTFNTYKDEVSNEFGDVNSHLNNLDSTVLDKADKDSVVSNETFNNTVDEIVLAMEDYKREQSIIDESQNNAIAGLTQDISDLSGQLDNKQDTLVSGTNIKTINGNSILGSGNIDIQGGGGGVTEQDLMKSRFAYHNWAAFLNSSTPFFQVTNNGIDWTEGELNKEVFAENENNTTEIINNQIVGVRYIFQDNGLSYSNIAFFACNFKWSEYNPAVNITIEASSDGINYQVYGEKTNVFDSAMWTIIPIHPDAFGNNPYMRITIIKSNINDNGTKNISCIRLMASRPGDQGKGIEYEKPYQTNGDRYIYPWKDNSQFLGLPWLQWSNIYGKNIYEDNVALVDKYANKTTTDNKFDEVDARIDEIELFKSPNVTIFGAPTINNGQISGFTENNYAQFPFLVDFHNQAFEINMCFTTGNQVTAQENIFDSIDGLAFAVRNRKFVVAMSSDGQTWNMGEHIGTFNVTPNTTYYVKFSWNRLVYTLNVSTDKQTYTEDIKVTDTRSLFAKQIIIGKSTDNLHIFSGSINLNNCSLTIMGQVVWKGMDDAGLATRLATDMSNIDAAGEQKIKDIVGVDELVTYDYIEDNYTPLTNFNQLQQGYNTFVANQTSKNNEYDEAIRSFGNPIEITVTFSDGTEQSYKLATILYEVL